MELQITEFSKFESEMAVFRQRYSGVVYDLTQPEQEKQARSDRYSIGKTISALDKVHQEIKRPLKERVDLIDGERRRIKDQLLSIQGEIKAQIDAHEKAIAEHTAMLQGRVEEIERLSVFEASDYPSTAQIQERLDAAKALNIDESYEYRKADATLAMVDAVKALEAMLADAQKREAEAAELQRLREEAEARERAEREERIRKEAAEKAEAAAAAEREAAKQREQALKNAIEEEKRRAQAAAEKAKRDAIEAANRAEDQARLAAERATQEARAKLEAEQAAKAQAERVAKEKETRQKAKASHTKKIHAEAILALSDNGVSCEEAARLVRLIAEGAISHVTISY